MPEDKPLSRSSHYLHKHNAVRPYIAIPRGLWADFQRAVDKENARTNKPELRLSRSYVVVTLVEKWVYDRLKQAD
ncbi:MAG: hypothetical protein E3J60_04725 [Dehalococcoidia bacterium]|nr:MAG: hypothetical protein E3J60_04725 [Dehalococcoidia bacterium]